MRKGTTIETTRELVLGFEDVKAILESKGIRVGDKIQISIRQGLAGDPDADVHTGGMPLIPQHRGLSLRVVDVVRENGQEEAPPNVERTTFSHARSVVTGESMAGRVRRLARKAASKARLL